MEVAFAGRSNVGKSSLINALTGRKTLARTSNTPGRTQELNFFEARKEPASGWSTCPATATPRRRRPRSRLDRADPQIPAGPQQAGAGLLLVDARHGLKEVDLDDAEDADKSAVSYQLVLTKADQVKPSELESALPRPLAALTKHPAAFPDLLVTSSRTGAGMPELRAAMARCSGERGRRWKPACSAS